MERYISLISFLMGLITFTGGAILWYRGSVEKSYAAQRDFQHLKHNYEQLCQYMGDVEDKLDHRSDLLMQQFLELKGLLFAVLGERTSGGTVRPPRGD